MIVENYLPLKKQGSSMIGRCPFHGDTKPSMHVTDAKGIFKCFACGAAGDGITFVQKYLNIEFIDAMKEICRISGLSFESFVEEKKASAKEVMAQRVLTAACKIYQKVAGEGHPEFEKFVAKRKLAADSVTAYALGFAPKGNALLQYLSSIKENSSREEALAMAKELGMIGTNESGEFYDKFRERIMFPIWDQHAKLTGFSSRAVYDWQKAKYMNSSDSFVFNKGNILFGLHKAKAHIREKDFVLLVEGHMDLIIMHQFGFNNSIAIMGTALTENSIQTLARFSRNFYMGLDSDNAGFNATMRVLPLLLKNEIHCKYVSYAPYKDPDELIQALGTIELQKRLDEARDLIEVALENQLPDVIPEVLDKKFEVLKKIFEVLAPLGDGLESNERITQMAKRLGLKSDSAALRQEFQKFLEGQHRPEKAAAVAPTTAKNVQDPKTVEEAVPEYKQLTEIIEITKMEKNLIKTLIECPDCFLHQEFNKLTELIDNLVIKRYVSELRDVFEDIDDTSYPGILKDIVSSENYPLPIREAVFVAVDSYKRVVYDNATVSRIMQDLVQLMELNSLDLKIAKLNHKKDDCITNEELNEVGAEMLKYRRKRQEMLQKTRKKNIISH